MKRGIVFVAAAAAAVLVWREYAQQQRAQRELWTEVTDPIP